MGPYLNNTVTANENKVAQVSGNWREHRNQRENQSQLAIPQHARDPNLPMRINNRKKIDFI